MKTSAPAGLASAPRATALPITLAGSLGLASASAASSSQSRRAPRLAGRTRPQQVRALAEGWRDSTLYNDLRHTPGLQPDDTGWRNDPLLARQTVLTFRRWSRRTTGGR